MKYLTGLAVLVSIVSLAYAHWEVKQAAMAKVAACQMLESWELWDEFECSKAFKRTMGRTWF